MSMRVGDITASNADDEALDLVVALTGLTPATVRRRCRDAHGNMLLRNLFDDRWPNGVDDLEDCTVALARDAGLDLEIANMTGLPERTVARRLREEHGNVLVCNAFPELDEEQNEGDDDEGDDDDAYSGEADPSDDYSAPLSDVGNDWSRPRMVKRIMTTLGFEVGERLRTVRFQEVVRAARAVGVEMCLADQDEPLGANATSPGIQAKVRLRRINKVRGRSSLATPLDVQMRVVVTPSAESHLREVPGQVSAPSYELALLRLQLLTAVPSLDRERSPLWPHAFVEAALRNLVLEPHQASILSVVAQNFRRGFHDPVPVAASLRPRVPEVDWEVLLADFERLNSDNAAAQIVLDCLRAGPSTSVPQVPVQRRNFTPLVHIASTNSPRTAGVTTADSSEKSDGRDLGALEDMFD